MELNEIMINMTHLVFFLLKWDTDRNRAYEFYKQLERKSQIDFLNC